MLEHLEPKSVFAFFEELSSIPRGSNNTKAVSDWCVDFARKRGLAWKQDAAENVVIFKEASPGYEQAEPVILQGHLDMVCEKEPGCPKDMAREGLDLAVDGDFVYAKGTTLGGDDGIAVAMALAILDDDCLPHPALEVILTTGEEIGMLGAAALDVSSLRGRRLLNLDSEEEGVFTVSCAGGSVCKCTLPVRRAAVDGAAVSVAVRGLTGGHSGVEIHRGGANANVLLGRVLQEVQASTGLCLDSVWGGLKDNAIPVEATARAVVSDLTAAGEAVRRMETILQAEYRATDPTLTVCLTAADGIATPMDADTTSKVICMLVGLPNGVQAMSHDISGLVQTSLNLGILATGAEMVEASFSVRSSVDSQKKMLHRRLEALMVQLGGSTAVSGDYPGWAYREDSLLRNRMMELFEEQYGHAPRIEAIHAGVECGLLCGKIEGLDCVSIGPNLTEIHTPRERMSIASVQRVWRFITELLRRWK